MAGRTALAGALAIIIGIAVALNFYGPYAGYVTAAAGAIDNAIVGDLRNATPQKPANGLKPTNPGEFPTPAPGQVVTTGYEQLFSFEVREFPSEVKRDIPDKHRIQFDVLSSVPIGFEIWRGNELIGGALNARMEHYGYVIDLYEGRGGEFTFKFNAEKKGSALVIVASKAEISSSAGGAS